MLRAHQCVYTLDIIVGFLYGDRFSWQVALIDGIVMGGGAGISINGSFRVVTAKTVCSPCHLRYKKTIF